MNVISDIKTILFAVFISIEALFTIIMFIFYFAKNSFFDEIGKWLYSSNEIISIFTVAFPVGIFLYSLNIHKELLRPEQNNAIFYKWSQYRNYKITTFIGIIFCALPIIPAIMSWIGKDSYIPRDLGFYYVLLLGISIISATSLYLAHFKVKEILDQK